MNKIGHKIRQLRENKGLSQDSIAHELGITQPSYARLEKQDERISITRLIQIASLLKTTVSDLIDENSKNVIHQTNNKKAEAYNVETIIKADKEHITTLKDEISFLRGLLVKNSVL
jgi:transcriptional regulator with XRE-family HTH domain